MSIISGTSQSALNAFSVAQAVTANNIANVNSTGFTASDTLLKDTKGGGVSAQVRQGSDSVDISKEAVDMMTTSTNYGANIKAIQVADKMNRDALDIVK
jgi:flagellar hook protein FlgE